jgi:hypothetical protein
LGVIVNGVEESCLITVVHIWYFISLSERYDDSFDSDSILRSALYIAPFVSKNRIGSNVLSLIFPQHLHSLTISVIVHSHPLGK